MSGDPTKRNQNLYCHYHQEWGHTTENCRNQWDHLDQLVGEGKLKSLLHHSSGKGNQMNSNSRKNATYEPPLGTINVIFAAFGRIGSCPSRVMSVARLSFEEGVLESKGPKYKFSQLWASWTRIKPEPSNPTMMPWWLRLEYEDLMWNRCWWTRVVLSKLCILTYTRG